MALLNVFRRPSIRRAGRRPRRTGPPLCFAHPAIQPGDVSLQDKDIGRSNVASAVSPISSAEELAEREAEVTASVPDLLDQMNSAAKENNKFKVELSRSKDRYEIRDRQFKQLHEEIRQEYGQVVDRAEPYFKAMHELTTVSHRVRTAVGKFKAAAAQYCQAKADLKELKDENSSSIKSVDVATQSSEVVTDSKATRRVTFTVAKVDFLEKVDRTREERNAKEKAYENALQDFRAAQEVADAQRALVGNADIRAAQPGFRRLHQQQSELSAEKVHMDDVEAKSETARSTYCGTLAEINRISNAVRQLQQEYATRSACMPGSSFDSNCGVVDGFSDSVRGA